MCDPYFSQFIPFFRLVHRKKRRQQFVTESCKADKRICDVKLPPIHMAVGDVHRTSKVLWLSSGLKVITSVCKAALVVSLALVSKATVAVERNLARFDDNRTSFLS